MDKYNTGQESSPRERNLRCPNSGCVTIMIFSWGFAAVNSPPKFCHGPPFGLELGGNAMESGAEYDTCEIKRTDAPN